MTPEQTQTWITGLGIALSFLTVIVGMIFAWIVSNKATITGILIAIRDIHKTVSEHADPKSTSVPAPLPAALK